MSMKIKYEIWQANKKRTSAKLVERFVSQRDMEKYLDNHHKLCPENKDGFNHGRHEWNDCTIVQGVENVRSICDFCNLMIVDVPLRKPTQPKALKA